MAYEKDPVHITKASAEKVANKLRKFGRKVRVVRVVRYKVM